MTPATLLAQSQRRYCAKRPQDVMKHFLAGAVAEDCQNNQAVDGDN